MTARSRKPAIPTKVVIRFEGVSPDYPDFHDKENVGYRLLKTVVRQVNIDEHKCQYDWESKSGTLVFWFDFKKSEWANKAAIRAAGLHGAIVTKQDMSEG